MISFYAAVALSRLPVVIFRSTGLVATSGVFSPLSVRKCVSIIGFSNHVIITCLIRSGVAPSIQQATRVPRRCPHHRPTSTAGGLSPQLCCPREPQRRRYSGCQWEPLTPLKPSSVSSLSIQLQDLDPDPDLDPQLSRPRQPSRGCILMGSRQQ